MQIDETTLYIPTEGEKLFPMIIVDGKIRLSLTDGPQSNHVTGRIYGGGAAGEPIQVGHLHHGLTCKGFVYADSELAYPAMIKHIQPDDPDTDPWRVAHACVCG